MVFQGTNKTPTQVSLHDLKASIANGKYTTDATLNAVAPAGDLTGSAYVVYLDTGAGANALTTRTAAQMFADHLAVVGETYILRILSGGSGTITLTAGTGVTINGTATIATTTWREFLVTFVSATAMTFQNIGGGNIN